jgi:hypothetical protein
MSYYSEGGKKLGLIGAHFPITLSDTLDISIPGSQIFCNSDYTVKLSLIGDDVDTYPAISAGSAFNLKGGQSYPFLVKRVWATGTTGGAVIWGIY